MKKAAFVLLILGAVTGGFYFYRVRTAAPEPVVTTQPFSRGDIVDAVSATGTLEAVETVEVGTQVSGVVRELNADFNSIVRKGQVIARLDPQLIQTQIEQQSANVLRAEADLERLKVSQADAEQKLERAQQLNARSLIPRTELETAEVNVDRGRRRSSPRRPASRRRVPSCSNQRVNLGYTTITAPIDGIVISRNVDAGQTVAASMNAPTLFVLAADLTRMQVVANIDESDVGRMRPGQSVSFQVDAYPNERFTGTVSQVRLQPTVVQNVVTYSTVITVPNLAVEAQAGDDRQRQHRDPAPQRRAASRQRGDAVPAYSRDVLGVEPARPARVAADRHGRTRRTGAHRRRQPVTAPAAAQRLAGTAGGCNVDDASPDHGIEGDDDRRAVRAADHQRIARHGLAVRRQQAARGSQAAPWRDGRHVHGGVERGGRGGGCADCDRNENGPGARTRRRATGTPSGNPLMGGGPGPKRRPRRRGGRGF